MSLTFSSLGALKGCSLLSVWFLAAFTFLLRSVMLSPHFLFVFARILLWHYLVRCPATGIVVLSFLLGKLLPFLQKL